MIIYCSYADGQRPQGSQRKQRDYYGASARPPSGDHISLASQPERHAKNSQCADKADHRATTITAGAARRAQEAKEWTQYNCFRRAECARLFVTLPTEEQAIIEELARAKSPARATKTGSIAEIVLGLDKARIRPSATPTASSASINGSPAPPVPRTADSLTKQPRLVP
jgi:hypothetical protein